MKPPAGAVHVWRVDLDAVPDEIERLLDGKELEVVLESGAVLEGQLSGDLAEARSGAVSL